MAKTVKRAGDEPVICPVEIKPEDWPDVDFVVSFGYRHIIKGHVLYKYEGKIINIHMSILPFNRGASPNFWSWFDGDSKGVTIHMVDAGLDTGEPLMRRYINDHEFRHPATLATTYNDLIVTGIGLFDRGWTTLKETIPVPHLVVKNGSYHRAGDEQPFLNLLGYQGWNAPTEEVVRLGKLYRERT